MNIDIDNIESLLDQKKYDDVRNIISAVVAEKLTDKEKGSALVEIASIYMDISNAINTKYRDALQEAIEGMKLVKKAESKIDDQIKIVDVRESLKK